MSTRGSDHGARGIRSSAWVIARRAYRQAVSAILVSAGGGLLAGVFLGGMGETFGRIEGLLVLLPALLATRGNVYGTLGARVATGLHQGLLDPDLRAESDRLGVLVAAALTTGLLASALAALLATLATAWLPLTAASFPTLLAIALVSGALSGVVLATVVVGVAVVGYRNGQNPDTLVGPVVTTTGDVVGVAALFLAAEMVLRAGAG